MTDTDNKTMRPGADPATPDADKTMRPGAAPATPDADKTMRPGADKTMRPNIDKTMRPNVSQASQQASSATPKSAVPPVSAMPKPATAKAEVDKQPGTNHIPYPEFILNGKTYKTEACISASTGEAEIFLVKNGNKQYALKLYYRTVQPNSEVQQVLKANAGSGLLADIEDYGTWQTPAGETRNYELMPYYSGGTLDKGNFKGRSDELKPLILKAVMALNFCHKIGILHKDIKPGNFFFTDETHKSIVLADFGISSVFQRDEKDCVIPFKNINQMRTRIYAAPELYSDVIQLADGRVEIEYRDTKSDFFSLGMVILTLWIGEQAFAGIDERSLNRMKRREGQAILPYPDDMPPELLQLVKGFTLPDPEKRWSYPEFDLWIHGKAPELEQKAAEDQVITQPLHIIWSGSKNMIAHSFEELADFMINDTDMAEDYLYTGKISKWMADAGYPEYQTKFDAIINKRYPKNRFSGVMAATYILDPDLPFIGQDGDKLYTNEEIALELANNSGYYKEELTKKDAALYVFFDAQGVNYSKSFMPLFKENPWTAVWRLVYTLYPQCPFPFYNNRKEDFVWCNTVDELVDAFADSTPNGYANVDCSAGNENYTPTLLYDECFYMWLSNMDAALAGKVRSEMDAEEERIDNLDDDNDDDKLEPGSNRYQYLFYLLAPQRNYYWQETQDQAFTAQQVGQMLNQDLMDYYVTARLSGNQKELKDTMSRLDDLGDFIGSRLYYYLKSKGTYEDKINYISFCFETDSKDNRRKCGPYDINFAIMKAIASLAGDTFYHFPVSNTTVHKPQELSKIARQELEDEFYNGFLDEWLAVQYQENPQADLKQPYAYEKLTEQYALKVNEVVPDYTAVCRYRSAITAVNTMADRVKSTLKGAVIRRWLLGIFAVFPLSLCTLIVLIDAIGNDSGSIWPWFWLTVLGLLTLSVVYRFYIKEPIGKQVARLLTDFTYDDTVVQPIHYGWHQRNDDDYDWQQKDDSENYISNVSDINHRLSKKIIIYGIVAFIACYYVTFTSDSIRSFLSANFPSIAAKFDSTDENDKKDNSSTRTTHFADVNSSLTVRSKASASSASIGSLSKGEKVEILEEVNGFGRIKYQGKNGYVSMKFMKPIRQQTGSQSTTGNSSKTNDRSNNNDNSNNYNNSNNNSSNNNNNDYNSSPKDKETTSGVNNALPEEESLYNNNQSGKQNKQSTQPKSQSQSQSSPSLDDLPEEEPLL